MATGYLDTVEVEGPSGRVRINASDLDARLADGYTLVEGSETKGRPPGNDGAGNVAPGAEAADAGSADDSEPEASEEPTISRKTLSKMKEAELVELLDAKGVELDLSEFSKIGEKRDAVADALGL